MIRQPRHLGPQRSLNPDPAVYVFGLETFSSKSTPAWKGLSTELILFPVQNSWHRAIELEVSLRISSINLFIFQRNRGPGRYRNLPKITPFTSSNDGRSEVPWTTFCSLRSSVSLTLLSTDLRWHGPPSQRNSVIFTVSTDHWKWRERKMNLNDHHVEG